MPTTTTANTLLPPAVRVAKLLGTVGASYAAGTYRSVTYGQTNSGTDRLVGAYLTTSMHTVPSLTAATPRDLALTLSALRLRLTKPLIIITTASSSAFAFISYYLYSTPVLTIPLASITLSPGSFLPHGEATEVLVGGGWELYAAAAGALAAVIPWQMWRVSAVEKRIVAAGEGIGAAEKRGLKTSVVDNEGMRDEAEKWGNGYGVSGALAGAGALLGAYAAAWW